MQMVHYHIPHPNINLTPTDPTCVRSTLEYMSDHARQHGVTPVIAFDQQLWGLAYMIIESQPAESPLRQIILVLGGFRTRMSFLGTTGSLMARSALNNIISQVYIYAEGSVEQMLSVKAVGRAVRAHFLLTVPSTPLQHRT
jgi:hypothetical protein